MLYCGIVVVYIVAAVIIIILSYQKCTRELAEAKARNPYRGHNDEDDWWLGVVAFFGVIFLLVLGIIQFYRYNIDEQYVLSEWHVEETMQFVEDKPEVKNLLRSYLADKKLTNKEWYALRKFEKESKLDNFIYGEN